MTPVWANIYEPEEMTRAIKGHEAVIHLASSIPSSAQKLKSEDWLANNLLRQTATESLCKAASINGVKAFVAPTIMLAYGDQHGKWVDESQPLSTDVPADIMSAVKMEEIVRSYVRKVGLQAIVLRLGMVYAEDSKHTLAMVSKLQAGEPVIIGKGDTYWNMIHADDAASAITHTVRRYGLHIGATYNICDGQPVKAKEYVDFLARSIGAPAARSISKWQAWLKFGKDNVRPLRFSFRATNSKALEKLKWQPEFKSFREGITSIAQQLSGTVRKKAA